MTRLILDHFRRWGWVLSLAAALAFACGWLICAMKGESCAFWVLAVSMWMGATLLSFDLKHGLVRTLLALPLTARQIGRGWWFATVGIPAVAMALLLLSGAAVWSHFHPGKALPVFVLAASCLFSLLWLGNNFSSIYGMTNELFGSRRERLVVTGISVLSMIMLFGSMLLAFELFEKPLLLAIFIGIGLIVTVASWLRAERFVLGRASFRLTVSVKQTQLPRAEHRPPVGAGGIPYLLRVSFIRGFFYLAAMVALMTMIPLLYSATLPRMGINMLAQMGSFMSLFFVVLFLAMPALRQLRLWRTLPISATRLALLVIALAVLPLIGIGTASTLLAALAWGQVVALTTLKSYALTLVPAALSVLLAAWLGTGRGVYILLFLIVMTCGVLGPISDERLFHHPIPVAMSSALVVAFVTLCFLLTRQVLMRSSRAYRAQGVQENPLGG
jgi:hypothetical protein